MTRRPQLTRSSLVAAALAVFVACGNETGPVEVSAAGADVGSWEVLDPTLLAGHPRRVRDPRTGIVFVLVPPGEIVMGADAPLQRPVHLVRITRAFYLGETEVTEAQLARANGAKVEDEHRSELPARRVSHVDASAFCARFGYRLPSEAEWELACRAGADAWWRDERSIDERAWTGANSGRSVRPVATREPNALGLYDMLGNVWEWVADSSHGNYRVADPTGVTVDPRNTDDSPLRVVRGGSWFTYPRPRPSDRGAEPPDARNALFGFRVACLPPE